MAHAGSFEGQRSTAYFGVWQAMRDFQWSVLGRWTQRSALTSAFRPADHPSRPSLGLPTLPRREMGVRARNDTP